MNRLGTWLLTLPQVEAVVKRTAAYHRGAIEKMPPGTLFRVDGDSGGMPVRFEVRCEELRPSVCRYSWRLLARALPQGEGGLDAMFSPTRVRRPTR